MRPPTFPVAPSTMAEYWVLASDGGTVRSRARGSLAAENAVASHGRHPWPVVRASGTGTRRFSSRPAILRSSSNPTALIAGFPKLANWALG
jgi:hypothetical protein